MKSKEEKFIEQSDHPHFYRWLIEKAGFKVKFQKSKEIRK